MKKLFISIIIILVLILTGITIIKGLQIGNLKILGIAEIKKQNQNLDDRIKETIKLTSTDYPKKIDDLNSAMKELEKSKSDYEENINISTDSEIQAVNQYEIYDIGMLWIELGNYAKSEGVTIDVSAKELTLDNNLMNLMGYDMKEAEKIYKCNLYFTATGTYAGIAGYIENIEDDSKLGFRIEEFKMIASSEGENALQATFKCKEIRIKGVSNSSTVSDSNSQNNVNNSTNTNNNTNTNNTDTNNTNTNNTTDEKNK